MTVVGTIYSYAQHHPRIYKALVVAKYNGLEVKFDDKFVMGTTNKTPEWIAKFGASQTQISTVRLTQPFFFTLRHAVAHYKDGSSLVGRSKAEEAHIQQWIQFVDISIAPFLNQWVIPLIMPDRVPYNKFTETTAIEKVKNQLSVLDQYLIRKTYLVGERITLADISCATSLFLGFKNVFDTAFRKDYPALTRWFTTVINQTNFKAVTNDFVLCETAVKYVASKKDSKEKRPKEEKPKEEKKPKAKEPEPEAEESFEDAPKPKSKLELLPAAKMPLDEWKR
ncbi:Elongation factor 1-gamma 1, partial [Dissophora globulifera]